MADAALSRSKVGDKGDTMNTLRTTIAIFSILAMLLFSMFALAASAPVAPRILTYVNSSTMNVSNFAPQEVDALAGNITFLTLTAFSQTRAWQGYWGDVSGTITLDDANNWTFYNWSAVEPRGYIYATRTTIGTPSWLDVTCFNHAGNATVFDANYGISTNDYDNVTNTYNTTLAGIAPAQTVFLVDEAFTTCPANTIWQSDEFQNANFVNYLMRDPTKTTDAFENESWVFGTIIERKEDDGSKADKPCYNGIDCDFQLLVAEDGHGTDTVVTTYYIWVDLQG